MLKLEESLKVLATIGFTVGIIALLTLLYWVTKGFNHNSFSENMNGQWALELLPFLLICIIGGFGSCIIGLVKTFKKR